MLDAKAAEFSLVANQTEPYVTTVGAFEAKTHFSSLLERVARGEQIIITRHGTPVARLAPVGGSDPARARSAIERIKASRTGQTLGDVSWRDLRDQGRR
jgi:prevent-host-death family protein